jgi:hypothetical protein
MGEPASIVVGPAVWPTPPEAILAGLKKKP